MDWKLVRSCLVAAALIVLASAPLAAQEKAADPSKPPAELAQLSFFGGTWSCTGTAFAMGDVPEHETSATVKGGMAIGGRWMHVSYDEKKDAGNAMPIHAAMYMGWDASERKFVLGCVDNMGGYCTQTSSGWDGDEMAFEGSGHMMGQKMGVKDTFTKKGPSQVTHLGELQGADGKWAKLDEEVCKKAGK